MAKEAITIIKSIDFQVGRTGILTPVARLKNIQVSNVNIRNVTLHNIQEIKKKDFRIGDKILIKRAGDVIPKVISIIKENRNNNIKKIKIPVQCPVCNSSLIYEKNMILRCSNKYFCISQIKETFLHFSSKKAMNIKGLGINLIKKLINKKIIFSIPDIFSLNIKKLLKINKINNKRANIIMSSISKSKKTTFRNFLCALSIKKVGPKTAKLLEQRYNSLNILKNQKLKQLICIKGIGQKIAKNIIDYFNSSNNLEAIDKLIKYGISYYKELLVKKKFSNITFVLTGKLSKQSRVEAENLIEKKGGLINKIISKKTNYLLFGKNPGSKFKTACLRRINLLNEIQFKVLLNK